jgi:hypothetical protein
LEHTQRFESNGCDKLSIDRNRRPWACRDHAISSIFVGVVPLMGVHVIATVARSTVVVVFMARRRLVRDETVKSGVEKIEEIKDAGGFRDHR